MGIEDRSVRRRIAAALAHLCSLDDCKTIFVVNHGLELLLDLLKSSIPSQLITASVALLQLATKAAVSPMDVVSATGQVLRGEENLNNPANYDVVFLVEGMVVDQVESGAEDEEIPIQDIKWDVFESMMRFIYTDQLNVNLSIALDLLKVADQFLLDGLKCQCEKVISAFLSLDNVVQTFNLSGLSRATRLRDECIMFVLKQIQELSPSDVKPSHYNAVHSMLAAMPTLFMDLLTRA
ncbi:ARM REPEAT PROTEIN INTERACTING WITH ABF2-like [Lotus japonicus]|uniref:ARM REPEAT PROTEIN INTERACTING WITH ABF2-like n=1 Tax=Lotus japonicus TaxID=34305 RepID=UPI00258AC366|nr:ARM REPEAT PROTEIN INTERACTING WITH ABF2-like [Lotus japonicus]